LGCRQRSGLKKRIGKIEIEAFNDSHTIKVHYNSHSNESISIRGYETLLDLEYAIKNAIRKVKENDHAKRNRI